MLIKRSDFESEMRIIDRLIDRCATLPAQVFRQEVSAFHIIDFDQIWTDEFACDADRLTATAGDASFTFAVLRPDPAKYYYANFGKFPVLRFAPGSAAASYIAAVNEDPGGSPADAIVHSSEVVVVYPASVRWAIYADRNMEIGIVASMDEEMSAHIVTPKQSLRFFTAPEAVTELLPSAYRGGVPDEVRTSLVRNYTLKRR